MSKYILTDLQKQRIKRLELQLKKAVEKADFKAAKIIAFDIQLILRPAGYETKLMQIKNWLYEAALEAGEYSQAIAGLKAVKLKTNKNTRVHLEATALLAIAYLRNSEFDNAEPVIAEVLKNDKVIKSLSKRTEFKKNIIERFDEEVTLFSMRGVGSETLEVDEIQNLAKEHLDKCSENQIYLNIGVSIPKSAIKSIVRIDEYSKKQLNSAERLMLPSPQEQMESDKLGKTFFDSIKRTLYRSLCDPESDIYKTWFNNGLQMLLSKKYLTTAVVATLSGLGVGVKLIASSVVALILKFGIEVYCTYYKPNGIMNLR